MVVAAALYTYASVLDEDLSRQIWKDLNNVASQSTYNIQEQCNMQMRQTDALASHLIMHDVQNKDEIIPILEETAEKDKFKRVGFAMPDGSCYTTDGAELNVRERDYFIQGMQGKSGVSNRLIDYVDGKSIIVFSAPVYEAKQGEIKGVVFSTYDIEEFCDILQKSVLQEDFSFLIVDSEGNIMVSDAEVFPTGLFNVRSILEKNGRENINLEWKQILEEIDKNGYSVFEDRKYYVHISRMSVNNWYFVASASQSAVMGQKDHIMLITYILAALIGILSLLLVCYIVHQERKKSREMEKLLYEDPLTGGYSYQRFRMELKKALETSGRKAAFIIMDIDQFKLINELFGVKSGDDTLRHINQLWMEWIQPPEVFARRSADCFGVLAFYDDEEALLARVDSFVNKVLGYDCDVKGSYVLRPHLGIYPIQSRQEDFESMQNNAAIIHSMLKGNNSVYYGVFDQQMKERTVQNKMLEDQLEEAYRNREYEIYYQPKYDAQTQKLCGAEALIRWRKENGELIPPGTFIPLAEKKGMVEKLDSYVFEEVCRQLQEWKRAHKNIVPISVNLSRENLKNRRLTEAYLSIRNKNNLNAGDVEIELTESALFENLEMAKPILIQLRESGFRILMDDFGTGYSSLLMLKDIPVDVVKLDKSFVDDYNDKRGEEIIRCVINLMNNLQMSVTAEGVETKAQYEFLRNLGCDSIQGYYFARPMPAEQFAKML